MKHKTKSGQFELQFQSQLPVQYWDGSETSCQVHNQALADWLKVAKLLGEHRPLPAKCVLVP